MPDLELGAGADTMLTGKQIIPATGAHLKSAATDTLSRKLAGMPKAIAKCAWDVHGLKFDVFVS